MSRKKVKEEDLFEDEKVIPSEENNCFAFIDGKCSALSVTSLTKKDKINCGTLRCPFYKPIEHKNSVKHIDEDGKVNFESKEDYEKRTGCHYLEIGEEEKYLEFPHADWADVEMQYEKIIQKEIKSMKIEKLSTLKKAELQNIAREKKLPFTFKMTKDQLLVLIKQACQ